jgi:enoyl-CoA hydratase/carnithine racemase
MLGADRAAELGLVNRVVADGEVLAEAARFAEQIGRNAPGSRRTGLRLRRRRAGVQGKEGTDLAWPLRHMALDSRGL